MGRWWFWPALIFAVLVMASAVTSDLPLTVEERRRARSVDEFHPKFSAGPSFALHDDETCDFRKYVGMRTMIILATVAFGAMRLMLRTLSPTSHLELAREWTADE
jgi:hypothetical protein